MNTSVHLHIQQMIDQYEQSQMIETTAVEINALPRRLPAGWRRQRAAKPEEKKKHIKLRQTVCTNIMGDKTSPIFLFYRINYVELSRNK